MSKKDTLPDIQETKVNSIRLNRVGVSNVDFPIYIKEKKGGKVLCYANVNMFVSLKHNVKGINMCYDKDTEVLTIGGWKKIGEIRTDDLVATLNQKSKDIEYHHPLRTFKFKHHKPLYSFQNNKINALVTGNHRMLLIDKHNKLKWEEASKIQENCNFYVGSKWKGKDKPTICIDSNKWKRVSYIKFDTLDFMKILGFWIAEGCTYWKIRKQRIIIFSNTKPKILQELKNILKKYNINSYYVYQKGRLTGLKTINKSLYDYLSKLGKSPKRYVPEDIKELAPKYLKILLEYYLKGDGSINNKGSKSFYTASQKLAEDIQEIVIKCGVGCSIHKKIRKYGFKPGNIYYTGYIHKNDNVRLNYANLEVVNYKNYVYCLEVPNHTLLVKRKESTPIWCGNSRLPRALMKYRYTSFSRGVMWKFLYSLKKFSQTEDAYAEVNFKYFIDKVAPVTKEKSVMAYDCSFIGHVNNNGYTFHMKVKVIGTSNCPCSKEISKYGSHGQRSEIIVTIEPQHKKVVWLEDLISQIESSMSCEIYPVLKRPDEKYVTEKAYENPKFVEDSAREVALNLQKTNSVKWYKVKVINKESIHMHDAVSYICRKLKGKSWRDASKSLRRT